MVMFSGLIPIPIPHPPFFNKLTAEPYGTFRRQETKL